MVVEVMTRKDRLRRVVILCRSFARNLAFFRTLQSGRGRRLLERAHRNASFWRQINANFFDCAVLEWCKLLGDKGERHHWAQIVSARDRFESELFECLKVDAEAFQGQVIAIRHYRNKFVGHLDSDAVMNLPKLDMPKASVWFYHSYVVTNEISPEDLTKLSATPEEFDHGYQKCVEEAERIIDHAE
jgi:hypothetical protein